MRTKLLLLLAAATLGFGTAQAQLVGECPETSFEIDLNTKLHTDITVTNTGSSTVGVHLTITPVELGEGHLYQTCTKVTCFAPTKKVFNTDFELAAGETVPRAATPTEDAVANYIAFLPNEDSDYDDIPDGKPGRTVLNVIYANSNDANDKVEFTLTYVVGEAGVIETWHQENVVYPNPAIDYTVVRLNTALENNASLKVYDMSGNLVSESSLNAGVSNFEIKTSGLTSGEYHFTVSSAKGVENSGSFVVNK